MRRNRGKVATFRSIGIAERTTVVPPDPERNLAYDASPTRPRHPGKKHAECNRNRFEQQVASDEKHVANSEAPKKSRLHFPSVPKPCSIGYKTRPPLMKRFKTLISGLLGYIKGVPLDKGTTKPGPARFRLVHFLCPFGKAFYGDLWRNRPNPCPRKVNTHGHSKGRRREAAILTQHMMRWRLTREDVLAPMGTTMTRFDASNAFMSVHHTTLDKLVEASFFEDEMDRSLMKQRYRGAQISVCEFR